MPKEQLTVACVKWGQWCAPHTAAYVNRLSASVKANLTAPHKFVCFTDDPTGLEPSIEVRPLPKNLPGGWWNGPYVNKKLRYIKGLIALPYLFMRGGDERELIQDDKGKSWQPINLHGWWNKLYLFKEGVLEGRVLFLDLDTVIVGSLDRFAKYEGRLAILRDFYREDGFGSGVMMWDATQNTDIWDSYVRAGCPNIRRGDQMWVQHVRPDADILQDLFPDAFVSFKAHAMDSLPDGASVVCYHGKPRPHEVDNEWMQEHWYGVGN